MGQIRLGGSRPARSSRRPRLPKVGLPRPWLAAVTAPAVLLAPDPFMQAAALAATLFLVYGDGYLNGRRDLALDLLGGGGNARATRRAPSTSASGTAPASRGDGGDGEPAG